MQKLIALTAPVRVTPTDEYYNSYYYLIDNVSIHSDYSLKSIGEKLYSEGVDPYSPDFDEEIPASWHSPDIDSSGNLKDLVKLANQAIIDTQGIPTDYEMTVANLRLELNRNDEKPITLSQNTYISSLDTQNPFLPRVILPPLEEDQKNISVTEKEAAKILLPKSWREHGVLIGDLGQLVYQTPAISSMQQQAIDIYVEGFYDPGFVSAGGKIAIVDKEITSLIRSSLSQNDTNLTNGFNVHLKNINDAFTFKKKLETELKKRGIEKYWRVETYREYEFTKDFLQQLSSEKNLFTILSIIIIIVACSNIISMMVILVNDKKKEIGILRSMGASSTSIACIFGLSGIIMGFIGSIIGIVAALITLNNLQSIIDQISFWQGFELFNPVYYGEILPNEVSFEVLASVLGATCLISLISGLVPAIKACMLKPSEVLRSE